MSDIAAQSNCVSHGSLAGEFLQSLSFGALEDLFSLAGLKNYEPNRILFTEGDRSSSVEIILDGEVRLFVHAGSGRRLIFRNACAGDLLGLAAAFAGKSQCMTAQTIYPCSIASIRQEEFMGFLLRHPAACQSAGREMSRECFRNIARLRTMGLASSAQARLAGLLLEWSAAGQQTNRGRRFRVPMTHGELGDCIGASRETISRTMSDLQKDRVLELRGSLVTILDPSELETRSIGR
ncbi:MAG TPA: Crp/Fnr family transcriptional regulator [Terracidiphilus sp.]|nr:Crp/Fnr family transcriptional regulator [Terracidiphilus sp.]